MQSVDSNYYEKTIAALREKARTLRSTQHVNVIARAIESLELKQNMSTVEDDLNNHAPLVLDKIFATNREPKKIMQVITQEFFATIKTMDGQAFVKFGEDMYSVEAKSGVYLFTVHYVSESDKNYISVIREQATTKREARIASYIFSKLPRFISMEEDVLIIRNNFVKMHKRLARCWKYLTSSRSPSNSSIISEASTDDDPVENPGIIVEDFINNMVL